MFAGMSEIFKSDLPISNLFNVAGCKNEFDFAEKFENIKSAANQMQHFNSENSTQQTADMTSAADFDNQSESSSFNPAMMYLSGAQKNLYDEYMKQLENIF
jgi:hypothetical protein